MPPPLSSLCGCRRADLIARFPQSIRFHARSPLQLHWRINAAVSKAAWWPWPFDLESGVRVFFAVRTVSDWNQLPAVVVEQENPAAFKAQLARCAPVRMLWPTTTTISVILHEEVYWLLCKTRQVTCDVGYLCANFSLPRPFCSQLRPDVCDRHYSQTYTRQTASSLNAPHIRGGV